MITIDNEWQRMRGNDTTNENEWEQMKQSDFNIKMKQKANLVP